jgi:hypothetical protein
VWKDDRRPATTNQSGIWSSNASLDSVAPTAPGNVRVTGGDTSVLLEWDASTDANGVAYYDVFRATSPGGPYARANPRNITQTARWPMALTAAGWAYAHSSRVRLA